MNLFSKKKCIGIDIGTNSLKFVQLKLSGQRYELENYAIIENKEIFGEESKKSLNFRLMNDVLVDLIKGSLQKAKMTETKKVVISIPAYLAFITVIEMPVMSEKELSQSIEFEARQYIPIPLKEVMLDWQIIGQVKKRSQEKVSSAPPVKEEDKEKTMPAEDGMEEEKEIQEVLLMAVPNYLIDKYKKLITKAGLTLENIELENFSLVRSLLGNDKSNVVIVDFGAQSTDVNLVSEGIIREVRTLDVNGIQMTRKLAKALNISNERAEILKRERGLKRTTGEEEFAKILLPSIDVISEEIKRMQRDFLAKKKKSIERVILTGGTANLSGLVEYLSAKLEVEIGIGNPFKRLVYPQELNNTVIDISSIMGISIGLAMRGLMKN